MLSCSWLLMYSLLAFFSACNPAVASTAMVELIEEDEVEEEDDDADIEEGSSTEDLVPKQVPAEVEEEGTALAHEDGVTAE